MLPCTAQMLCPFILPPCINSALSVNPNCMDPACYNWNLPVTAGQHQLCSVIISFPLSCVQTNDGDHTTNATGISKKLRAGKGCKVAKQIIFYCQWDFSAVCLIVFIP